jgi:hypothetical protein
MLWPGERIIRRIGRQGRRDRVLLRLHRAGPADVYADLLAYAHAKKYSAGWAYYAFLEIFGTEPDARPEPKKRPSNAVMEWAAEYKRKPPAKRGGP